MARTHTPIPAPELDTVAAGETHPRPPALETILPQLTAPFFTNQVYVKPGAVSKERSRALALIYLDRRAIAQRLDDLVGARNWTAVPQPWGDNGVITALTILGVTKYGDGEGEIGDPNCKTSASAQAFKRAFTEFGCRYTYTHFPRNAWFDYDERAKGFANPYDVILRLYQAAGLDDYIAEETVMLARDTARKLAGRDERPAAPADTPTDAPSKAPPVAAGARAITARQLMVLKERGQLDAAHTHYGVTRLEDLTFAQASALISNLPRSASARA